MPYTTKTEAVLKRKVNGIFRGASFNWIGDGFRVSNYFPSGHNFAHRISPFLLFDYHAPYVHAPTSQSDRGVGSHPHRGFETVTLAWQGSIAHHDSAGNSGVIGPGDVQWMTAGSGILHKEYHEVGYARTGGPMHMAQIWVNLPSWAKMTAPKYQGVVDADITRVVLPDDAGFVRVIAGEFDGVKGPVQTFTPLNMFDIRLNACGRAEFAFPAGQNTGLMVIDGKVVINGETAAQALDFALFDNEGERILVEASADAHLLLLNGEPINEPVVQHGPFVMNTEQEIRQAIADFNSGKFGDMGD
ncbi:short-chain dehydrogenase [Burkholderia sp. WAC0059]|uniref:pirin family protein n=1 Tax=Burkholderia sp. WAC0059 TaxID=2066022 RepID=UPI000C7EC501|nr:pirin family protein [Burkholderia sp. WAC0059]PLZ02436.1 short-chain dehydrogenase [Burkholderia sp. WAC0059]